MEALFQPLSLKSVRYSFASLRVQPVYFLDLDDLNKTAKTTILLPQKSGNRQSQPFLPSHPAPPPFTTTSSTYLSASNYAPYGRCSLLAKCSVRLQTEYIIEAHYSLLPAASLIGDLSLWRCPHGIFLVVHNGRGNARSVKEEYRQTLRFDATVFRIPTVILYFYSTPSVRDGLNIWIIRIRNHSKILRTYFKIHKTTLISSLWNFRYRYIMLIFAFTTGSINLNTEYFFCC